MPAPKADLETAVGKDMAKSRGVHGYRCIVAEQRQRGWTAATKAVLKLKRPLQLACRVRRRKRCDSHRGGPGTGAPTLLDREFDAAAPDVKRLTDVIEFAAGGREAPRHPDQGNQCPAGAAAMTTP